MNIINYKGFKAVIQPLGDIVNVTIKKDGNTFFRSLCSEPFECTKEYWGKVRKGQKYISNNELLDIVIKQSGIE